MFSEEKSTEDALPITITKSRKGIGGPILNPIYVDASLCICKCHKSFVVSINLVSRIRKT